MTEQQRLISEPYVRAIEALLIRHNTRNVEVALRQAGERVMGVPFYEPGNIMNTLMTFIKLYEYDGIRIRLYINRNDNTFYILVLP